ncbi:hypothetical protein BC829DRAFT_381063 [Chytridium lagenaria]|nr:hypothetical protein BC829DRAFT_381063 [Chytridium lagenaria]
MPSKRIIIIGGGLAGLALALALKRVGRSTGLNLDVVVFEEKTDAEYNESGGHYLLWRWAVDVLIEMGLGGKLSRIAAPFSKTNEDLVQWPPSRAELGTSSTSVEEELGVDSALPPMVSARRCDLLRLLMIALSGRRDDLVFGDDFLPSPANNSDMSPEPMLGLEADLASGSWFETENFKYLVPELVLGECLESYTFESGRVEVADVLVRKILVNGKGNIPAHAGTCILSGITRLVLPPNGKPIEDLHRDDVHEFFVAKSLSFGMTNLGNGMLGWNLVVAQTEPNQHTRKMVSEAIAKNPRSSIVMSTNFSLHNGAPDPALQDKWGGGTSPSGRRMMNMYLSLKWTTRHHDHLPTMTKKPLLPATTTRMTRTTLTSLKTSAAWPLKNPNPPSPPPGITAKDLPTLLPLEALAVPLAATLTFNVVSEKNSRPRNPPTSASTTVPSLLPPLPPQWLRVHTLCPTPPSPRARSEPLPSTSPKTPSKPFPTLTNPVDAALLAKLLAKNLVSPSAPTSPSASPLPPVDDDDTARAGWRWRRGVMKEARAEGDWSRTEHGWVRSLMRIGRRYTPSTWTKASYTTMLTRGAVRSGLPSLMPVGY